MRRKNPLIATAVAATLAAAAAQPGLAANAAFQAFFFDVCASPSGTLATRCAETPGALGNISGDSESSLNPSHNLSHNLTPLSLAHVSSAEARERGERARDEGEATEVAAAKIDIGPFAIVANARGTWFERERDPSTYLERGIDGETLGVEIGFDKRVGDRTFIGALLAAEQTEFDFDAELPGVNFTPAATAGDAETDAYSLTAYLTVNIERGFFEGSIGYVQQDRSEMEVLFALLAERYERRSVMITSNLVFSQWEKIFKDPMTTAAAIDRVVHHSVILELNVPSYRAEAAQARNARKGKSVQVTSEPQS